MRDHPGEMRVHEALELADKAGAMKVRRMQVAVLVAQFMMPAMHGRPGDHPALPRHRAEDAEEGAHHRRGLETAMGEQAVIPDGNTQSRQYPHDREECDVDHRDGVKEEQYNRTDRSDDRQHIEEKEVHPLQAVQMRAVENLLARLIRRLYLLEHLMSDLVVPVQHVSSSKT